MICGNLDYRIWSDRGAVIYAEEPAQSKVIGAFYYLQEALDFVRYCVEERGSRVVLTGPCGYVSVNDPGGKLTPSLISEVGCCGACGRLAGMIDVEATEAVGA